MDVEATGSKKSWSPVPPSGNKITGAGQILGWEIQAFIAPSRIDGHYYIAVWRMKGPNAIGNYTTKPIAADNIVPHLKSIFEDENAWNGLVWQTTACYAWKYNMMAYASYKEAISKEYEGRNQIRAVGLDDE